MKAEHPVAGVYAEALLEVARPQERIDDLGETLRALVAIVRDEPDLRVFLESPAIGSETKKKVLENALRGTLDDSLVNFLCLLVEKKRIELLDEVCSAYGTLADRAMQRARVHATSAVPLPDDIRTRLVDLVREKLKQECILETDVTPDLLGGLVWTVGDRVFEGSVRGRLDRLRKEMIKAGGYED